MILDRLVAEARERSREREGRRPQREIERAAAAAPRPRGFAAAVAGARGGLGIIAELKRASPSAGVLRRDFDVATLAGAYARGGAAALSVLTEERHFQGALQHLEGALAAGPPCLQKDFLLSEYQLFEGRAHGADAVLLIAEAVPFERLRELVRLGLDLEMDVLVEAHAPANVRRAAGLAEHDPERVLVGINNRDLATFEVSLATTFTALRELPRGLLVVSESGIRTGDDLVRLRDAGARGALVGEHLMRARDVEAALSELLAALHEEGA